MFNVLIKLQRQPLRVRKQIALIGAAVVTGIIVMFWLVSLSASESASVAEGKGDDVGPFQALTETVGAFISDTVQAFRGTAGVFSAFQGEHAATSSSADVTR